MNKKLKILYNYNYSGYKNFLQILGVWNEKFKSCRSRNCKYN